MVLNIQTQNVMESCTVMAALLWIACPLAPAEGNR